jgi:hypothetical protein
LSNVLLPEPLGPTTPIRSPLQASSCTPLRTLLPAKDLAIPSRDSTSLPERGPEGRRSRITPPAAAGRPNGSKRAKAFSLLLAMVERLPAL